MKCDRCGSSDPDQDCYVCALTDEELERMMLAQELAADYYREKMIEERLEQNTQNHD